MDDTLIESTQLLKVSDMAEDLIGSEIIKLAGEVKDRIRLGQQIYNCTIGDFDPDIFPIPKELRDEIIKAYKDGETNYPPANGIQELRESISRFLHTRGGLEYNETQILIAGGARPLIHATYQTIIDPEDVVIFPVPSWNNNHYCHLAGAKPVMIETSSDNNFMPTADKIKPYVQDASMISLCSPLNPAGTVFDREALADICDLVLDENRKRGELNKPLYLLYDQVYWQLTQNSVHHDPVSLRPEMKNYTIYIDGLSKAFAATGVRVGWAFGPRKIINKMKSIVGHIGAWAPRAEQVACAYYLQQDDLIDSFLLKFKASLGERLNAFYYGFQKLKEEGFKVDAIPPQAAMYLPVQIDLRGMTLPNGEKLNNNEEVAKYILEEGKIALVPFNAFGSSKSSNWYRLSIGTASMQDVTGFFKNLRNILEKLS